MFTKIATLALVFSGLTLAVPLVAQPKPPKTQVWSRVEGDTEHRLTIEANSNGALATCCALEGRMQIFVNGKQVADLHLEQELYQTWWDEGTPVSITILPDRDGGGDPQTFNTMLLDKDTLVLSVPFFPNRNKIYRRVR